MNPAPGQVPPGAFYHSLRYGETLDDLARRYGRSPEAIIAVNRLTPSTLVYEGYQVLIPAKSYAPPRPDSGHAPSRPGQSSPRVAAQFSPRARPTPIVIALDTPAPVTRLASPRAPAKTERKEIPASATRNASKAGFRWPVAGTLERDFSNIEGDVYHGVDIAAPPGTSVQAAAAGNVDAAGDLVEGYGKMVVVKHAGGYTTIYANLGGILVRKGQIVAAGDPVGVVGQSSASAPAPHLHFQVRKNNKPINPLTVLPGI